MRFRLEPVALALVVIAVVPYLVLKVLWLTGATIGVDDESVLTELHSTRMVVGNNVTIGLELLAVGLALALTSAWGRRVPAWIMLGLGAGATGLLAPILLGLPIGSVLQFLVDGDVHTAGMDHLSPWVFATVYGGFALMAVGISALAWRYAATRWGHVLRQPPQPPSVWAIVAGALGLIPFGAAMLWWGVFGPGASGPQGMDAVAQRTTLVVTGLLAVGGFLAPLSRTICNRAPRLTWLLTWVGCTTAALQAPTQVLLANGGHPTRALVLLGLMTVPGSSIYGLLVLRRHLIQHRRASRQLKHQILPVRDRHTEPLHQAGSTPSLVPPQSRHEGRTTTREEQP
ncbi:MAG TPA: hypothetical protein VE645_08850 [Pseudonocardiaceae bacterium]|nr:hypothetical protein [Pseudonocardiaceae bacterium]